MTILTARDWQDVDVCDVQVVFAMDGYPLVFYIRVVFDGVGLVWKVMLSLTRKARPPPLSLSQSCLTKVYPDFVRSLDLSLSLVS